MITCIKRIWKQLRCEHSVRKTYEVRSLGYLLSDDDRRRYDRCEVCGKILEKYYVDCLGYRTGREWS